MRITILLIAAALTLAGIGSILAGVYSPEPEHERPIFTFFLWMFACFWLWAYTPTIPTLPKDDGLQIGAAIVAVGMTIAAVVNTLFWAYCSNMPWKFTSLLWMFASFALWVRAAPKSQRTAQP